jgi:ribonuclease BN (tRNA processing enzyme)
MRITILPSWTGTGVRVAPQFLTSYLVNDSIAVDAGCLGFARAPEQLGPVKHVLVSHTHLDHVASLPIFLDAVYTGTGDCVTVHGSEAVLDSLQRDLFNERVWPDFLRLSQEKPPFLKLNCLVAGKSLELDGVRLTPVEVNHAVPTFGFLLEDGLSTVVLSGDTGPTDEIWHLARQALRLKAVFLEATFPDDLGWLAAVAGHLTPTLFRGEMAKLDHPSARWIAVHIHPRHRDRVVEELQGLGLANLEIGAFDQPYHL